MSALGKKLREEAGLKAAPALPIDDSEPIEGEITRGPFSNPLLASVLKRFGKHAFARTSVCMEFDAFLKRILGGYRGGTCLEIGTYQGISAVLLAQYFDLVICVSIDIDPERIVKKDIVAHLGLGSKIKFYDVADNAEKKKLVDSLDFDFCYSDGDHANDARFDFDLVKRCGRVLLHEAWPIQSSTWNLACSLPKDEMVWADYDCFAFWKRNDVT